MRRELLALVIPGPIIFVEGKALVFAGDPGIRSIDLRAADLLSLDFTTSGYGSLEELFDHTEVIPHTLVAPGYEFGEYATLYVLGLKE